MRETGPVSKGLSGEEAAPYIGLARTMLGQLKNQMAFAGLPQGKWARALPDGTTITVRSIFGQDKISVELSAGIEPPSRPAEAVPVAEQNVEAPELLEIERPTDQLDLRGFKAVGTCTDLNNNSFAVLWHSIGSVEDLGGLPGGFNPRASQISNTGQCVVGSALVLQGGFALQRPWRWTRGTGMVSLGQLPGGEFGDSSAVGVSDSGEVVIGNGQNANGSAGWVWINGVLLDMGNGVVNIAISPNGQWVVATDSSGPSLWQVRDLAVQKYTNLPGPGTSSVNADGTNAQTDLALPVSVSSKGEVFGGTTHFTSDFFFTDTTFYDIGGGVPTGFVSGVPGTADNISEVNPFPAGDVFIYDGGELQLVVSAPSPIAAAEAVATIVGNQNFSKKTAFENIADDGSSRVRVWNQWAFDFAQPWHWNRFSGLVEMTRDTFVADISTDARFAVGRSAPPDPNVVSMPLLWTQLNAEPHVLALLPGCYTGDAASVASIPLPPIDA